MKIVMKCSCGWQSKPMKFPPPPPEEIPSLTYNCQNCHEPIACHERIPAE